MYTKLDDKLPRNPKILAGGIEVAWYYVCALAHCGEGLTDGFIAESAVTIIAPHIDEPRVVAERCAELELFQRVAGGYLIPDYTELNKPRSEVIAEREAGKERAAKSREQRTGSPEGAPNVRRTHGGRSPDQSSPVLTEVVHPQSVVTAGAADPSGDGSNGTGQQRFDAVVAAIVEHRRQARDRSVGASDPIKNLASWRRKTATDVRQELGQTITDLLERHNDTAPPDLIAARALGERAPTLKFHERKDLQPAHTPA